MNFYEMVSLSSTSHKTRPVIKEGSSLAQNWQKADKPTNQKANKKTNKQNKQTNKTNKQTNKQNKQTNKQNKQTKQTNKRTKQTIWMHKRRETVLSFSLYFFFYSSYDG